MANMKQQQNQSMSEGIYHNKESIQLPRFVELNFVHYFIAYNKGQNYSVLIGSQGRAFFFNWGQNYLALIGCWFAKYVVLATMPSRFVEVDENGIIDLMFCSLFFMAKFSCLKAVEWICILKLDLHTMPWIERDGEWELERLLAKRGKSSHPCLWG